MKNLFCCRTLFVAFLLLAAFGLISGCGGGGGGGNNNALNGTGAVIPQPNNDVNSGLLRSGQTPAAWTVYSTSRALSSKPWTVLVYINGANDLGSGAGNYDIQNVLQMEQVGSSANLNIVVQWEAESFQNGNVTTHPTWTGTRRYYLTRNIADTNANISSQLISQNSTVDTGDWQSLQDFVQWGVQAFPAQHYCLVVWDHGAGWRAAKFGIANRNTRLKSGTRSAGTSSVTRGVSFNYATGSVINTAEIPEAINISGTPAHKWDVVAFDCSLMQMVETAAELSNPGSAAPSGYIAPTYIEGSEESPPGSGLPYTAMLQGLANNPAKDPLTFAKDICDQTINEYGTVSDSTQSVVSSAQMATLVNSINTLGVSLTAAQKTWGPQIALAQNNAEAYAVGEEAQAGYWYWDYHDLLDFTNLLTNTTNSSTFVNDAGVLSAAHAVQVATANAIVYNRNGTLHPNSHGLSIWIPSPADFVTVETQQANYTNPNATDYGPTSQLYTQLSLAQQAPAWLNFLQTGPSTYTPSTAPASYGTQ